MTKTLIGLLLLLSLAPFGAPAQLWRPVSGGVDNTVTAISSESEDGMLYAAGRFLHASGGFVGQVASWDGNSWVGLDSGLACVPMTPNAIFSIEVFGPDLFLAGFQNHCGLGIAQFLQRWDGSQWHYDGLTDGPVHLSKTNGELFAVGLFDTLAGMPIRNIGRFTGSGWEQFGDPGFLEQVYHVNVACHYKGEYYFGGNFNVQPDQIEIVKWDGTQWIAPGGGIHGDSWVDKLVVYDSLLWVGGSFPMSAGNAGQHIMTWDGSEWANPFTNVAFDPQIRDMEVIDDVLYISGGHYVYSDGAWHGPQWLAKYDGTDFCSFGGADIYSTVIGSLNGKLYAGAAPTPLYDTLHNIVEWMGGDQVDFCARQAPPLGRPKGTEQESLFILSPNPVQGQAQLRFALPSPAAMTISIVDPLGRILHEQSSGRMAPGLHSMDVDLSDLPAGVYFLRGQTGQGDVRTLRFVKG